MLRPALALCALLLAGACTEKTQPLATAELAGSAPVGPPEECRDLAVAREAFGNPDIWLVVAMDSAGRRYSFLDDCSTPPSGTLQPLPREFQIVASLSYTGMEFVRPDGNRCYQSFDTGLGAIGNSDWIRACARRDPSEGDELYLSEEEIAVQQRRPRLTDRIREKLGIPDAVVAEVYLPPEAGNPPVQRYLAEPRGLRRVKVKPPRETAQPSAAFFPQRGSAADEPQSWSYTATLFQGSQCVDYINETGRRCRYCRTPLPVPPGGFKVTQSCL